MMVVGAVGLDQLAFEASLFETVKNLNNRLITSENLSEANCYLLSPSMHICGFRVP